MGRKLAESKRLPRGSPAMERATEAVRAVLVKWPHIWQYETLRGTVKKSQPAGPDGAVWTVFCDQMARAAIRAAINEVLK